MRWFAERSARAVDARSSPPAIGWWSSTSEPTCISIPRRSRCLRRPPAPAWEILWSSDDPAYGGAGTAPLDTEEGWRIPGQATVVLSRASGMSLPFRRLPCPSADPAAYASARVARHQRSGRLCLRHHLRHRDAPLPRAARLRAAGADRADGDAQLPSTRRCVCPSGHALALDPSRRRRRRRRLSRQPARDRSMSLVEFRLEARPARLALRRRGTSSSRSAC